MPAVLIRPRKASPDITETLLTGTERIKSNNHMVVNDNNVMKLEMRFLLIFIFKKQKRSNAGLLKQMRRSPRNKSIFYLALSERFVEYIFGNFTDVQSSVIFIPYASLKSYNALERYNQKTNN